MSDNRPESHLDLLQDKLAEDFRKAVVVLALLLLTCAAYLLFERIPRRWSQVQAMQYIDYVLLANNCLAWLFCLLCGIMAGFNFDGIQCSFAAYFCLLVIGLSKLTVLLLMTETLHYIHAQIHHVSRRQDKQYMTNLVLCGIGIATCLIWVFIDFRGETRKEVCHIIWHRESFLYSLVFLVVANTYLTFRCSYVLLRTKHTVMRAWAYRYISGFVICTLTCLLNLGFMAVCRGRMAIFICLTACLVDATVTNAALFFLLHPNPAYTTVDDMDAISAINMSPEMEEEMRMKCPSIHSKAAPTYRTRQASTLGAGIRGTSMRSLDMNKRVSCTLVSGATGQGIAAYLSQIDQDSSASPADLAKDSIVVPRHVSLLPSHPAYAQRKWPKPMYSHYPNYSVESLTMDENDEVYSESESTARDSFNITHPDWSDRLQLQRSESSDSAKARAMLYGVEDEIPEILPAPLNLEQSVPTIPERKVSGSSTSSGATRVKIVSFKN